MDYAEIKARVSMIDLLGFYGVELRNGRCTCPIHGGDNKDAFSVHSNNQAWKCHTKCDCGGDIFTFIEKKEGLDNSQSKIKLMEMFDLAEDVPLKPTKTRVKGNKVVTGKQEYTYTDKDGKELFKTLRVDYEDGKKDCFQSYKGKRSLPKEVRTLYNLHLIHGNVSDYIILCEGEKTADSLVSCGYIATTNPLGSKNWNEEYAKLLAGQRVIVMPDADEHGEKWRDEVIQSLAGIVEQVQIINISDSFVAEHPEFSGHDFADLLQVEGKNKAITWLQDEIDSAEVMPNGVDPKLLGRPIDIWQQIKANAKLGINTTIFNFNEWIPSLNVNVKQGDLVVLMGNTSTGKTRLLHNVPFHIKRLNFVVFDLELSQETLALRYAAMENKISMTSVESRLKYFKNLRDVEVDNVFIQKIDTLTLSKIKERVELIERVTGRTIHCIAIDYVGLMAGVGSAYESTSKNVEEFKAYIGASNKCGILTTQVARPDNRIEGMYQCPSPFHAKNSGSIENSAQTLIGFWKDRDMINRLYARVLKHTHGSVCEGDICLDANDLLITEANGY